MEHDELEHITIVEQHLDDITIVYEYEDLPLPADDPYVRRRQKRAGEDPPSEVITWYSAAAERPRTFPVTLPFIADHEVWTTVSPAGTLSTGARWRCDEADVDAVAEKIVAACVGEGWTVVDGTPLTRAIPDAQLTVLRRAEVTRMVTKFDAPELSIVQLTDVAEP